MKWAFQQTIAPWIAAVAIIVAVVQPALSSGDRIDERDAAELLLIKLETVQGAAKLSPTGSSTEACGGPKVPVQRGEQEESVAVCFLTTDEVESVEKPKTVTTELSTGNDSKPWRANQKYDGTKSDPNLADDVGRTFDVRGRMSVSDDDGFVNYDLKSDSFGRRVKVKGRWKDSQNRPHMELLNVTSFSVTQGLKLPGERRDISDYQIIEGSVVVEDGSGKTALGGKLQSKWHETAKSGPQYSYVDSNERNVTAILKTGYQRVIEGDLGKFKCKMSATGLVGLGSDGKALADAKLQTTITTGEIGGRSKNNPLLALDLYRNHLVKQRERPEEEIGVRVSTSVRVSPNITVKPFIGISQHDGENDRAASKGSRQGRSPYYTTGFIVEYK